MYSSTEMKQRQTSLPEFSGTHHFKIYESPLVRTKSRRVICCEKFRLICLILVGWAMSVFIAIRILIGPVNAIMLERENQKMYFSKGDLAWIGHIAGLITYILMPITCGVLDIGRVSYRFGLIAATMLLVVGNLGNVGVGHPYMLLFTECFICGIGSNLALSVIMLSLDTYFTEQSKFRVLATTLCQGSIIASFSLTQLSSTVVLEIGWQNMQVVNAAIILLLGTTMIFLIPESGFDPISDRPIYDERHEVDLPWKDRLLSMSSRDMDESPIVVPWLIARLSVFTIHIGIYTWLLRKTEISKIPELSLEMGWRSMEMLTGYCFSAGQTITYIFGGVFGTICGRGHLIKVYIFAALSLFFSLILWQLLEVATRTMSSNIGISVVAFLSGAFLGLQETFLFAASQEATRIPSRRSFPFSQMMNGVAYVVSPLIDTTLNKFSIKLIFIVYGFFSLVNFIIFIYNLHCIFNYKNSLNPTETETIEIANQDSHLLFRREQSGLRSGPLSTKLD